MAVALCSDLAVARAAWRSGMTVVLVGTDAAALGRAAAAMREEGVGGSRVAVVVGDPADPAVWAAARSMAAELFGEEGRPLAGAPPAGPEPVPL